MLPVNDLQKGTEHQTEYLGGPKHGPEARKTGQS